MESEKLKVLICGDAEEFEWHEFIPAATTDFNVSLFDRGWQTAYTQLTDEFVVSGASGKKFPQRIARRFAGGPINRPRHARFETTEDQIGFPGETAGSTVEWPSLWRDPEGKEMAREALVRMAQFDRIEINNLNRFIEGAELCLGFSTSPLEQTFHQLAKEWREATALLSDSTEICMDPSYQRIIGLGASVVPLIIAELEHQPDHWFWALRAITGENPVSTEYRGRVDVMAECWIHWYRERVAALNSRA